MSYPIRSRYINFFRHFSCRLAERYNVFITMEEYIYLCDNVPQQFPKLEVNDGKKAFIGFMTIKDKKVKVVKSFDKLPHVLITALPK